MVGGGEHGLQAGFRNLAHRLEALLRRPRDGPSDAGGRLEALGHRFARAAGDHRHLLGHHRLDAFQPLAGHLGHRLETLDRRTGYRPGHAGHALEALGRDTGDGLEPLAGTVQVEGHPQLLNGSGSRREPVGGVCHLELLRCRCGGLGNRIRHGGKKNCSPRPGSGSTAGGVDVDGATTLGLGGRVLPLCIAGTYYFFIFLSCASSDGVTLSILVARPRRNVVPVCRHGVGVGH
mmetsp:Transcript_11272/g.27558  ORF Transcript_11272/g.27558 Transcript_11272/m.27558 type:complete len:234 (+) Transcript_11272:4816-5517(+)